MSNKAPQPQLTILVPTYNPDIELLHETLRSIKQLCESNSNVETLLVDNGSEQPVSIFLESRNFEFESFRTFRFEENLGFSKNIHRAAKLASGELIWFIGDDDLVVSRESELANLADILSNATAIALNVNFFQDGNSPSWLLGGVDQSSWAGSALSSLIFRKTSFVEAGETVLNSTQDRIWIHFLVFNLLNSSRPENQATSMPLPQISVRLGRTANWEGHFGSQYLAGLSCLKSLFELCEHGIYSQAKFADLLALRLSANLMDVLTLTGGLSDETMLQARRQLGEMVSATSLKIPSWTLLCMLLPRWARATSSRGIHLVGKLLAAAKLKFNSQRSVGS